MDKDYNEGTATILVIRLKVYTRIVNIILKARREGRHGGSWVQIPSGTRIFSESTLFLEFT